MLHHHRTSLSSKNCVTPASESFPRTLTYHNRWVPYSFVSVINCLDFLLFVLYWLQMNSLSHYINSNTFPLSRAILLSLLLQMLLGAAPAYSSKINKFGTLTSADYCSSLLVSFVSDRDPALPNPTRSNIRPVEFLGPWAQRHSVQVRYHWARFLPPIDPPSLARLGLAESNGTFHLRAQTRLLNQVELEFLVPFLIYSFSLQVFFICCWFWLHIDEAASSNTCLTFFFENDI